MVQQRRRTLQIRDLHADDLDSNHALDNSNIVSTTNYDSMLLASWTSQPSSVPLNILKLLFLIEMGDL